MAGQRPTRRGKAHREAFPALDILEAERSVRRGGGACQWRNERGQIVGHGTMVLLNAHEAIFQYDFVGSNNINRSNGVMIAVVSRTRRNPVNVRSSFHCPGCTTCVQKMFFVAGEWACGSCHDLVFLKQRLGKINKKIMARDEMLAELMQLPAAGCRTRWVHNRQRHIERINRELAAAGFSSLPQELLYRTYAHWAGTGDEPGFDDGEPESRRPAGQGPGLACLQPLVTDPEFTARCEPVGSKVLHRPVKGFLREHAARRSTWLKQDVVLRPLILTSGWTAMSEAINQEGQTECTISATYEGERTLWPFGSGTKIDPDPQRAILDDEVVMLRVRLPATGTADPQAELRDAAARLEAHLVRVRDRIDSFNATRSTTANRHGRQNLLHEPSGDRLKPR